MGLFGKKKTDAVVDAVLDATPVDNAPKRKRKDRGDNLSSVLQETVTSAAITEFRSAGNLNLTRDGKLFYLGMFLDTSEIGGLSKNAAKHDKDKGSIIEHIKGGHIKVLITAPLMEDNAMVIIPTRETLEIMGEYMLLRNAPYETVFVSDDGSVIDLEGAKPITYEEISKMVNNGESPMAFLEDKGVYWVVEPNSGVPGASGDLGNPVSSAAMAAQATQALPVIDTNASAPDQTAEISYDVEYAPAAYEEDALFGDPFAEQENEFAADSEPEDLGGFILDEEAEALNQPTSQVPTRPELSEDIASNIPAVETVRAESPDLVADGYYVHQIDPMNPNMFQKYLTRKFYSEDIGLDLDFEPFDAYFMQDNPVVLFDDERGDGWINSYLNEISRIANIELMRLHTDNLRTCRMRYGRLISLYLDRMSRDLDMNSPNTNCGKLVQLATSEASDNDATRNSRAEAEQQRIRDEYEKRVEEVGETGRRKAIDAYRNNNDKTIEKEINRVYESLVERDEQEYRSNLEFAKKINREEAAKRLDYGITKILSIISEQYREMLDGEEKLYQTYRQRIQQFLDNNRKEDIAYVSVLEEEQRQAEKAEAVRMEYVERLKAAELDNQMRRKQAEDELAEVEAKYKARIQQVSDDADSRVNEYVRKNEDLRRQLDDMIDKYAELDETKDNEYKRRIAELKDENAAANERITDLTKQHKRSSYMSIGLAIAVAISALCAGLVIGLNQKIDMSVNGTTVVPIVQSVDSLSSDETFEIFTA